MTPALPSDPGTYDPFASTALTLVSCPQIALQGYDRVVICTALRLYCTRSLYIRLVSSNTDTFKDLLCTYAVLEEMHGGQDFGADTTFFSYSHTVMPLDTIIPHAPVAIPAFTIYLGTLWPLLPMSPSHPIQNIPPPASQPFPGRPSNPSIRHPNLRFGVFPPARFPPPAATRLHSLSSTFYRPLHWSHQVERSLKPYPYTPIYLYPIMSITTITPITITVPDPPPTITDYSLPSPPGSSPH